jgi:hypothetical protein
MNKIIMNEMEYGNSKSINKYFDDSIYQSQNNCTYYYDNGDKYDGEWINKQYYIGIHHYNNGML